MAAQAKQKPAPLSSSTGIGIAMTDLFLSASAALIVALALSSNDPVREMPVQADLLLLCPTKDKSGLQYAMFAGALLKSATGTDGNREMTIGEGEMNYFVDVNGFNRALSGSGLTPRLFHIAALANSNVRPLTTTCIKTLTGLVRGNNKRGKHNKDEDASAPLFGGTIGFQIISAKIRVVSRDGK